MKTSLIPLLALSTTVLGSNSSLSGVSGPLQISNSETTLAIAAFVLNTPNLSPEINCQRIVAHADHFSPMQTLGPAPNGMKA